MRIFPPRPAARSPITSPNSARPTPIISASASPPSTAMSTRSATAEYPSPSSRCQSRSCSRWRWIRSAPSMSKARSASSRRAIPSIRSGSTPNNHPFNPMVNAGAIACSGADPRGQGRRRLRIYPPGARPVCRARTRRRRGGLCFRKRNRRPQPRDRLSPAQLRRHQGRRRRGAGRLFPAMLDPGDGARYRRSWRRRWPIAASIP